MFQQVFNDKSKKYINRWNRNYLFFGTAAIVAVNILLFAFCKGAHDRMDSALYAFIASGSGVLNTGARILRGFLNSFAHLNWQHVLLNMVCFASCGLYLERKTGSVGLVLLVLVTTFFTATAMGTAYESTSGYGFSGVIYGIYSYLIIDYLLSLRRSVSNKLNVVLGASALAFMYISMCFSGGATKIQFEVYPYNLVTHTGHFSGFIAGIFVCLTVKFSQFMFSKTILAKETGKAPANRKNEAEEQD